MKQILHLLIVDRNRRAALAATCGSRWLLPVVTCDERTRAVPLIVRWCAEHLVIGDVAGQWLGRVTSTGIDWLVAIDARLERSSPEPALQWMPLDTLSPAMSVLEYQQWAVERTLARGPLPSVEGPFGKFWWPDEARAWVGRVVGSAVESLTPYRTGAYEVVVGADCAGDRVYCKGLTPERAAEARVTQALAAIEPESFARTLALEHRADGSLWWLTAACPGKSGGDAHRVAHALARIQQRVLAAGATGEWPRLDLDAAARWTGELLGDSPCSDAVRRQCTRVMCADVPVSWIPMDLDPTNVLVDHVDRVRFIDMDDSFLGPAPLAMATLAMRCGDKTPYRTYERSWSPSLTGLDWFAFEATATIVQFWLGWQRLERHVTRGEVFVDGDFAAARTRDRLVKAIDRISPCPARRDDREA
jgi:hypothetical protein